MPIPIFMILSGYVYTFAADTGGLREQYRFGTIKRKFMRYTLPMMVAFLLRNVLDLMRGYQLSPLGICKSFVLGTYGAGAYYYHLMVEFIFLAPLLYGLIAKLKANGIIVVGLLNFLYDVFCSAYGMDPGIYRILIFRYLFAIAMGMYVGRQKDKEISPVLLGCMTVIGAVYVIAPYAWGYSNRLFTSSPWDRTSMIAILYVFPVVYILLDGYKDHASKTIFGKAAERIGHVSYHIMYTQMIWYSIKGSFDRRIFDTHSFGIPAEIMIDLTAPVISGLLFELVLTKFLTVMRHKEKSGAY